MKSKVLATIAIISLLCCGTAMAQWPNNTYGNRTGWEVEIGTRILDRPSSDLPFNLVTLVPQNAPVFNASDASDLDASAGVEFRFLKAGGYEASWEIRGIFNRWEHVENRNGNLRAPLFTPPALPALTRPDRFDYFYDSEVFSLELNYKTAIQPGVTFLIGPRYVSMTEQVTVDSHFVNPLLAGFEFDLNSVTTAENQMPGLGIGLEFRRPLLRELFFVGSIKGAVLANFASTNTETSSFASLNGVPGPIGRSTVFDDNATNLAGIGEISARLHYDIVPGTISLYGGYEAMWLDGVALAPAQLLESVNPPVSLNAGSTSFAHGLVLGSMVRF